MFEKQSFFFLFSQTAKVFIDVATASGFTKTSSSAWLCINLEFSAWEGKKGESTSNVSTPFMECWSKKEISLDSLAFNSILSALKNNKKEFLGSKYSYRALFEEFLTRKSYFK